MAKNWMAWEAAEALYGENKEEIAEVASRYPLFARTVCVENSEYLLDILKALPKVTARVVETGLKELEGEPEVEETEEEASDKNEEKEVKKEKAPKGKAKAKQEEEPEEDEAEDEDEKDYSSMTSKELYALCCKRGLSSKCKKRDKASLIAVLKEADGAGEDEESEDDWEDEEEETKDPYAGKTAKELYMMCKQRGIKAAPKKDAAEYAKLLKKADEAEKDQDDSDDDDDWEI